MLINNANITGSLTVVGSTALSGSLTLSGSMTTTGTLTAQTLVIQTITSSITYSSGSNVFGNNISNTQIMTGSVLITGSQTITGNSTTTGTVSIGNDASNPTIILKTGGSTSYAGSITTNANTDFLNINGGAGANYNSGSGISLIGNDRYGTKTAGWLTLYGGNSSTNTSYGYISMETAGIERLRVNYGGQLLINTTSAGYNNPMLFISASAGVCVPLQTVADSSGRLIRFYNSDFNNSNTGTDVRMGFTAGSGNTSFNMQVYTAGETTSGNLILQPSYGYVGIGNSSPTNALQVSGSNIKFGTSGYVRNTYAQIVGTSTTADVLRFLDNNGSLLGGGSISGTLYMSVIDTATSGNQSQFEYRVLSSGNGTAQLSFTQVAANTRGTAPASAITAVNDGAGGQIKIQLTTAASGISGANVYCTFVGHLI